MGFILDQYMNESIINKNLILISDKHLSKLINDDIKFAYSSLNDAVYHYIKYKYNINISKTSKFKLPSNNKLSGVKEIEIDSKYKDSIDNDIVYVYHFDQNDFEVDKKNSSILKSKFSKVIKSDKTTINKLLKKINIKYKYIEYTKDQTVNSKLINDQIKHFMYCAEKYNIKKGLSKYDFYDDIDDFASKKIKSIDILNWNIWKVSKNPRDNNEYKKINNELYSLLSYANKTNKNNKFKFSLDCDWDDGTIILKYK